MKCYFSSDSGMTKVRDCEGFRLGSTITFKKSLFKDCFLIDSVAFNVLSVKVFASVVSNYFLLLFTTCGNPNICVLEYFPCYAFKDNNAKHYCHNWGLIISLFRQVA